MHSLNFFICFILFRIDSSYSSLTSSSFIFSGSKEQTWLHTIKNCPKEFEPGQFKTQTCFDGRFGEERGSDQFGVQIMIHSGVRDSKLAKGYFHYVEVRHAGQAFRLGRYPIHFHIDGDVNGSYVKGCAVHHSFNRAVTIHGVNNLVVEDNVIYDILGRYCIQLSLFIFIPSLFILSFIF